MENNFTTCLLLIVTSLFIASAIIFIALHNTELAAIQNLQHKVNQLEKTDEDEFVGRELAFCIAQEAKQLKRDLTGYQGNKLFSEDLW